MRTVRRGKRRWVIEGIPDCGDSDPYPTRAEAERDRRGMARTFADLGIRLNGKQGASQEQLGDR